MKRQPLSVREAQILALYQGGANVVPIAKELRLSVKSVSTYLTRAQDKLGLTSRFLLRKHVMEEG